MEGKNELSIHENQSIGRNHKINIETMLNKVLAVKINNETVEMLHKTNNDYLKSIVDATLSTSKVIIENSTDDQIAHLNNLVMVPWNVKEFEKTYNNVNYMKINPDRFYFITKKSITEVYFADTLAVEPCYNLIANTDDEFTIELIFKSARVRNREQFIYGNKYRFNYSKHTNKMTVRKLTE